MWFFLILKDQIFGNTISSLILESKHVESNGTCGADDGPQILLTTSNSNTTTLSDSVGTF